MAHRPVCKYDGKCYRKNDDHLKHFSHPLQEAAAEAKRKRGAAAQPSPDRPPRTTVPSLSVSPKVNSNSSPGKRARDESSAGTSNLETLDTLLSKPPPPRSSPLGISATATSLFDVFEMPYPQDELQKIVDVAKAIKPSDPMNAFDGWRLVGPFEVLLGKSFSSDSDKWRHFRFRYDPPEVQTIAVSTVMDSVLTSCPERHLAYHRDDPINHPTMVVLGTCRGNKFSIEGDSIAGVLIKTLPDGPALAALRGAFSTNGKLTAFRDKNVVQAQRRKQQIAGTLHGLGILVPYDKKSEVGYREMMLSLTQIKNIISAWNSGTLSPKSSDDIEEQFRFADIANDECDFGLNVELGLNLFALVEKKNDVLYHAHRILDMAYMLLGRGLFQHILRCHLPTLAGGPIIQAVM